jgi:hypothetical protein
MRTALGVALLAVLVAPALGSGFDEWLPESTIAYVSVENVQSLGQRIRECPLNALWTEESVQDFLALPRQKWGEMLNEMAEQMGGARPDELVKMAQGQVVLAMTGIRELDESRKRPGVIALVDVGDNGEKLQEWLSRLEGSEKFEEKWRRVEDEFRGVRIVTYVSKEEGSDDEMDPGQPSWFVRGSVFGLSNDIEAVKDVLVRSEAEDAAGLADSETYRTVRRRTGGNADVAFFVSFEEIWEVLGKYVEDEKVMPILGSLGLTGMRAMGGRMTLGGESMTQQFFIYSPGEKSGVMRLMAGKNSALVPPKFVPADVASAMTMAFDVQEIWAEARRVMDKIKPGMTKEMDEGLASVKEQLGVDIQADIIGSLGGTMTYYQIAPEEMPEEADPMAGIGQMNRIVFALELANAAKLEEALDTLLQVAPMPVETQEYMGVTLRTVNAGFFEMGFGIVAGHLVLATNVEDLRAVVQTQGKEGAGLAGSEDFRRAMTSLPEARSMVSYSDPRRAMAMMSQMLQGPIGQMMMGGNPEMAEWFDFSLFPEAEVFTKYMDVGGAVMRTEEEGILIQGISRMKSPK